MAHPFLSDMLTSAYDSLFWQSFVVTVAAGLARNRFLLQQFVTAHVMVLLITIGLFAMWPVTTAWVHLGVDADTLRSLNLTEGGWPKQLLALRTGHVHEVTSSSNFAIIGFPSYHCAAGLINIWATWRSRWLRWPMIGVSTVMIAATPIDGGHYLADLFGAVVAVLIAISASRAFLTARWTGPAWPHVSRRRPRPVAA